jgi:hypothetical protein
MLGVVEPRCSSAVRTAAPVAAGLAHMVSPTSRSRAAMVVTPASCERLVERSIVATGLVAEACGAGDLVRVEGHVLALARKVADARADGRDLD